MNNKELITTLSKTTGKKTAETAEWIDRLSIIIGNTLAEGNTISIQGFGTFEVKKKEERISVNPVTKKRFLIPPKLVPVFKPSATLKNQIKEKK